MNESLDVSRVAEEFSAASIHSAATQQLAGAVRSRGVAAAASVNLGDWQAMRLANGVVGEAFDAGASRGSVADALEMVAQLQTVMGEVALALTGAKLTNRRTVGR